MNDTESRLRDYLDTKATTVPSTAQGPGLFAETTPRRPIWPILATAASVAVVLALTVTVLTHMGPDKAAPAAPPTDAAPKVPYTVTDANWRGSVYDGSRTVRLPKNITGVIARSGDGWLTHGGPGSAVQILNPDGTLRRLGVNQTLGAVLSPDGKQVVTRTVPAGPKARIVVYDVASGAEVAAIPPPGNVSGAVSWNKDGIWIDSGDIYSEERLFVWKPGQPAATPVRVPSGFGASATTPASDIVVFTKGPARTKPTPGQNFATTKPTPAGSGPAPERCLQIGVVRDGALDVRREYCDKSHQAGYPVLSPDGKKVLLAAAGLTIDVATGKTTKLDLPGQIQSWPNPVFEDATKVLVVTQRQANKDPESLYRCEVTTGECKLLRTEKKNTIVLAQP